MRKPLFHGENAHHDHKQKNLETHPQKTTIRSESQVSGDRKSGYPVMQSDPESRQSFPTPDESLLVRLFQLPGGIPACHNSRNRSPLRRFAMGLRDWVGGQFIDIIEWTEPSSNE